MIRWLGCLMLLAAGGAAGDVMSWRCNGYLIDQGQTLFEVRERCGDPADARHRIEWRVESVPQQSCTPVTEYITLPAPAVSGKGQPQAPRQVPQTRIVCTPYSVPVTVPVEVDEWYFEDGSVPKLLYFINGRLAAIEPLWNLRRH